MGVFLTKKLAPFVVFFAYFFCCGYRCVFVDKCGCVCCECGTREKRGNSKWLRNPCCLHLSVGLCGCVDVDVPKRKKEEKFLLLPFFFFFLRVLIFIYFGLSTLSLVVLFFLLVGSNRGIGGEA